MAECFSLKLYKVLHYIFSPIYQGWQCVMSMDCKYYLKMSLLRVFDIVLTFCCLPLCLIAFVID